MSSEKHKMKALKTGWKPRSLDNRKAYFWSKIVYEPNGCWKFAANNSRSGYGNIGFNRKTWKAHRFSWYIHFGDIPEGMYVCHKCDNPACVNPGHLFLGTPLDNMRDKIRKGRDRALKSLEHPSTKLTLTQAKEVIAMAVNGDRHTEIAAAFGVSVVAINDILSGQSIPEAIASMPHASKCIEVLNTTAQAGERNGRAKLSWAIVDAIRKERSEGVPYQTLAKKYNVSEGNIWFIVKGHHWNSDLRERRQLAIRAADPLTANE